MLHKLIMTSLLKFFPVQSQMPLGMVTDLDFRSGLVAAVSPLLATPCALCFLVPAAMALLSSCVHFCPARLAAPRVLLSICS